MQNHDEDPQAAAAQLRRIAESPVPADQLGRFTWLANHVIGELHKRWPEAHELIANVISGHDSLPLAVLRNASVSAHLSGDLLAGIALERRMAQLGLRADQAATVVRAAAVSFLVSHERAIEVAMALRRWSKRSRAGTTSLCRTGLPERLNRCMTCLVNRNRFINLEYAS